MRLSFHRTGLQQTVFLVLAAALCLVAAEPKSPKPEQASSTGDLVRLETEAIRLDFAIEENGLSWKSLFDVRAKRELLAGSGILWRLTLELPSGRRLDLDNRSGWRTRRVRGADRHATLEWQDPEALDSDDLKVVCNIDLDGARATCRLSVDNGTTATIRNVVFPLVETRPLGDDGSDDEVVFPRGPGERHVDPFAKPLRYSGDYPSGWTSYQFLAHYDRAGGLYVATHDPVASTKKIEARAVEKNKALRLAFDWPAADATAPGNDFEMSGSGAIEVLRGDWFDAAQVYRAWASAEARWWPRGNNERHSPPWVRDVAVWALTGGTTQSVVGRVREFAEYMGVPTALHWYNWHAIPFDDDYPHYFPPKPDFREGVEALQAAGVRVMPYINGRLWDTDLEDFATTARLYATKSEKGEPYVEEYGSGQKLAAMCPVTREWRSTVNGIVLRLFGPECGVEAVYIDQVAAARPRLCYDRTHGHPLGGGAWWTTRGYWPMLRELRGSMIAGGLHEKMITTECNAEPYIHLFDAYLTWHFQYNGQVPVFPAIYGGQVQFFGRAYRGGPTKDLADRMKAAQSLVWGEQIGWIGPDVIRHKVNGPFIRRMARLRYALRDYLADGRMCRPPHLEGDIPDVTADWRWRNEWPVTERAVQAGAWKSNDGRLALLFANVTSETLAFDVAFDPADYDVDARRLRLTPRTETGPGKPETVPAEFRRTVRLGPFEALAWELEPMLER